MKLRATLFGRLATPLKPIMDSIFCESFFFFVPNRLVWEHWQHFNGEQDNPGDSTDYTIPVIRGGVAIRDHSIADYFGLPQGLDPEGQGISALPFRGLRLIWNEWFRDQNLQDSLAISKGDGPDDLTFTSYNSDPPRRNKRHDYFTSCLPWPQKTENPVTVPLQGRAPVTAGDAGILVKDPDAPTTGLNWYQLDATNPMVIRGTSALNEGAGSMYAELELATGFTINQLRQSFQIQKLFERDARGGTRYTEIVRSHFGVVSPDSRLQRPEFLGGGSSVVNINPVAQTTPDDIGAEQTPLGNLGAFGTVVGQNHGFTKSFTEHGYIIGLVNFRADLAYQQGINRMWNRSTRFDFFWPSLSHIGEMAVLSREIYADGSAADDDVWGYQEAWGDYRYAPSLITGRFKSQYSEPLDYWHLAQDFANRPVLNDEFIRDDPPIDRVIAVPDEPQFLLDVHFSQRWVRPMPLYGVPGLIDHF